MRTFRAKATWRAAATLALAGAILATAAPAQLRWRNGDLLPGQLLGLTNGLLHWASPVFREELVLDPHALEAVNWTRATRPATGAFRFRSTAGDVFTADLLAADDLGFLVAHPRFGQLRIRQEAIASITRTAHANLVFDGTQAAAWGVTDRGGPVKDLTYKLYDGSRVWPQWPRTTVPDVSRLRPVDQGGFPAGYLEVGLSRLTNEFAAVFTGSLETRRLGPHRFVVRSDDSAQLFVDGSLVCVTDATGRGEGSLALGAGYHALRLEYAHHDTGRRPRLEVHWSGPGFAETALSGRNPPPGWRAGPGGCLATDRPQATLTHELELPRRYAIELVVAAQGPLRFRLGLAPAETPPSAGPTLRLETWDDELVVAQGRVFEPARTLGPQEHELALTLFCDTGTGRAQVWPAIGAPPVEVTGLHLPAGATRLLLANQDTDLTVHRLRIHRVTGDTVPLPADPGRPYVRLTDGRVRHGALRLKDGEAFVVGPDGAREEIAPSRLDEVSLPAIPSSQPPEAAVLLGADGALLHGTLRGATGERVLLRTGFAFEPVSCALDEVASLRFAAPDTGNPPSGRGGDELFLRAGRFRGRLSFALQGSSFGWLPAGASRPLRLDGLEAARIERRRSSLTPQPLHEGARFPFRLHLKNGEVFPVRLLACDEQRLTFASPFSGEREIPADRLKALEFDPPEVPDEAADASVAVDNWLQKLHFRKEQKRRTIDPARLDHALTVPRFLRHAPPEHLLVARNGDLKRGRLTGIDGDTVTFEAKHRHFNVPLELLSRVVDISAAPDERGAVAAGRAPDEARITLWDGSVLLCRPLESRDGRLRGRSAVYGELTVPVEAIRRVQLGDLGRDFGQPPYSQWVARPAPEPDWGQERKPPAETEEPAAGSEASAERTHVPPTPEPPRTAPSAAASVRADAPQGKPVGPVSAPGPNEPGPAGPAAAGPPLGLVRVDAKERALRFPVEINQRTGLVEYALVTVGGKTHESVFRTAADPLHVHLGLLLLGGRPSYAGALPDDPGAPIPGQPVNIELAWREDGREQRRPLESFVITRPTGAPLSPGPWIYNGSQMNDSGVAARASGSIVALYLDPLALINNPRASRINDELHRPNARNLPENPEGLEMIIRLAPENEPAPPR